MSHIIDAIIDTNENNNSSQQYRFAYGYTLHSVLGLDFSLNLKTNYIPTTFLCMNNLYYVSVRSSPLATVVHIYSKMHSKYKFISN